MEFLSLSEKVAVITGGARGIGKETAKKFLQEGAKVVICDFDEVSGLATVDELGKDRLSFVKVDVTNTEQVNHMAKTTVDTYGRIDILVNNAGITRDGLLTKMDDAAWEKVVSVNLTGVYKCTRAVIPVMIEQKSGVILNASSVVGIYGNIGQSNYVASKAGVIGLTKGWAKEFGPKGIRVNAVAPGFVETEMTAEVPKRILDLMKEKTPLRKLGKPNDIAAAYLFLASDDANYINGAILSVDGGLVV